MTYRLTYRIAGLPKAVTFSSADAANELAAWLGVGASPAIERLH